MKVLIADDDPISRSVLGATLESLGYEPVPVDNGRDAFDALAEAHGPRLAILDWMMPGLDGIAVCRQVRRLPGTYVYVVLLTTRSRHEDMLAALEAEADDFLTKPFDPPELQARLRAGARIIALQERLLAVQQALRFEAAHDPVTGLANRGAIMAALDREAARAGRDGTPLAVGLIDVDRFKLINDTFGHHAGDAVLGAIGARLGASRRQHEAVGRYGGEEFLVLLPGCDGATAAPAGERIRQTVADAPIHLGDNDIAVTVSVGLAWDAGRPVGDALVRTADAALYDAKAAGRNAVFTRRVCESSAVGTPARALLS